MLIGVFDSGIGGLTVLKALQAAWPGHSTIYLGDTARVPYGSKSPETIYRYARQNTRFLIEQGVELLVIACNTASAYALDRLDQCPIPILGVVEPGAQAATETSRSGHIGVIGTAATIASGAYERAILARQPDARITTRACPLFVPLAEEGWEDSTIARLTIEKYLADWLPGQPDRPDTLVLGCTHYPVLRPMLTSVLGDGVRLIDSADATAQAISPYIKGCPTEAKPGQRLFVTDGADGFARIARRLLGQSELSLEIVDIHPLPAPLGE